MAIKSKEESLNYMEEIFNDKNLSYNNAKLWRDGWPFNWLGFNCLMFDFWDCENFSFEQRELIAEFQKTKVGLDGHNPYHDFVGNGLLNISKTLRSIAEGFGK
ncbi:MAG: hypothetical protein WC979_02145 [Candidatus Pacearchaeota archaeon]|jgi:hypothetical protein|nr:hypothetical protein [Clostridia bacterium]